MKTLDLGMTFRPPELERLYVTADLHLGHANMLDPEKLGLRTHFSSVEEMNQAIETSWNRIVPETIAGRPPLVILLGDVVFGRENKDWSKTAIRELLDRLHGEIVLIEGNHDRQTKLVRWCGDRFKDVFTQLELKFKDPEVHPKETWRMVFNHYRLATWNGHAKGTWHIHGHSHGTYRVWPSLAEIELLRQEVYAGVAAEHVPDRFAELNAILDRCAKMHRRRILDAAWDSWRRPLRYGDIRAYMAERGLGPRLDHHQEEDA